MDVKKGKADVTDIQEMIVNPCGDVPTGTGSGSEGPTGTGSGSEGPTGTGSGSGKLKDIEVCEDCYEGVKVKNGKKTCTCDFCFTYLGFDILDVTAECDKKCSGKLKDIEVGDSAGNTFMVTMDVKKGKADVTDIQEMIVNPCGDVPTGTGSGSEGPTGTGSGSEGPTGTGSGSGGPTVTEPCEDCYEG